MTTQRLEYKNKKDETPFETFLRYSDQKEKSAAKLGEILRDKLSQSSDVLDIGTGNGEYLSLILSKIDPDIVGSLTLTLVEPSEDLEAQLPNRFSGSNPSPKLNIAKTDLQTFESSKCYDVINMSHLFYHIPQELWPRELSKVLSMLKDDGILIIVLREKDDAYDFKMEFKPQLSDTTFQAVVIDDVLRALPETKDYKIQRQSSVSELHFPMETSIEDTISIIEFYLGKEWEDIPPHIQKATLDFIKQKGNVFKQIDGIACISKTNSDASR